MIYDWLDSGLPGLAVIGWDYGLPTPIPPTVSASYALANTGKSLYTVSDSVKSNLNVSNEAKSTYVVGDKTG